MKKFWIFIFIVFQTILVAQAQDKNICDDTTDIFGDPEELPIFRENVKSSTERMFKFIEENLQYTQSALDDRIEGRVIVQFSIDTAGYTQNHKILKGIREDLDREVLRIAKLIKFDQPAKNRGKPIEFCYSIPIVFKLPEK